MPESISVGQQSKFRNVVQPRAPQDLCEPARHEGASELPASPSLNGSVFLMRTIDTLAKVANDNARFQASRTSWWPQEEHDQQVNRRMLGAVSGRRQNAA